MADNSVGYTELVSARMNQMGTVEQNLKEEKGE
jgi:hypothetical protein